ncbi:hypothetical protein M5K25_011161 [Dendrobium thyrsiflorum]|uniref:Uncharacterized protein n=1 Tax=Dendrobium thyrsiflorum TaxID=117978 RepID=A0ABD0V346_DENTH
MEASSKRPRVSKGSSSRSERDENFLPKKNEAAYHSPNLRFRVAGHSLDDYSRSLPLSCPSRNLCSGSHSTLAAIPIPSPCLSRLLCSTTQEAKLPVSSPAGPTSSPSLFARPQEVEGSLLPSLPCEPSPDARIPPPPLLPSALAVLAVPKPEAEHFFPAFLVYCGECECEAVCNVSYEYSSQIAYGMKNSLYVHPCVYFALSCEVFASTPTCRTPKDNPLSGGSLLEFYRRSGKSKYVVVELGHLFSFLTQESEFSSLMFGRHIRLVNIRSFLSTLYSLFRFGQVNVEFPLSFLFALLFRFGQASIESSHSLFRFGQVSIESFPHSPFRSGQVNAGFSSLPSILLFRFGQADS